MLHSGLAYNILLHTISMTIAAFDFDGTITRRDTMLEFVAFTHGRLALWGGLLLLSPLLVLMKFGLLSNGWVKLKFFSLYYKGVSHKRFTEYCHAFFESKKGLVYTEAAERIKSHKESGDTVVIVSASPVDWVALFAAWLGVDSVLATELQFDNYHFSGKFSTPNCYGAEKVNRLFAKYPDRDSYRLVVYGDSRGDRELLSIADESHYRFFTA